jgi:peptide chain release factor 2
MGPPEAREPGGLVAASRDELDERLRRSAARVAEARAYLHVDALEQRRQELESRAAAPDFWSDPARARREAAELGRVVADLEEFAALRRALEDAETLHELMVEERDDSLALELERALGALEAHLERLELTTLLSGEYDERDAVVELHAGAGGTDAQDWCEMLLRMYLRWAERRGFGVEVDETTPGQEAGLLSATCIVKGRFAYGLLSTEHGVHRLVRMSPFDAQHRRHTSFAKVDVTPFLEEAEVEIDERDLRIDTYRSHGAGGQHVNKTDSAVRITHLPTGIVVSCQNERSQHQNRARALQILYAKLAQRERAALAAKRQELAGPQVEVAWGNQIRSYVLAPFQLVKDHRTGFETGNVTAVLDGDLDAFMEAELRRRRAQGAGPA